MEDTILLVDVILLVGYLTLNIASNESLYVGLLTKIMSKESGTGTHSLTSNIEFKSLTVWVLVIYNWKS